jgi:arylsulfatase A-like enzyme
MRRFQPFLFALTFVLFLCEYPSDAADAPVAASRPNIVFMLADDAGYGDFGCYGQQRIKTPNIDRMAAEGMRFTQFYAGATVCSPSRATLMTGLHNGHGWIRANDPKNLRPQDVVIPEVLKKAGYATGLVGKWGIGTEGSEGVPNKKGFDFSYGYLNNHHAHNHYPSFLWRNGEKEQLPNVVPNEQPSGAGVASKRVKYSDDLFGDEAVKFIEREGKGGKPFFLYLAFTVPHANNEAKNKGMEVPDYGEYANTDWPEPQKGQAAMVTRMDMHIGRVLAKLAEMGLDDKTLVIFSSDNGPHREGGNEPEFNRSSGPLRGIKRDLTDGGIRVPLVVRWPGKVKAGTTNDFIGYFADMMPTFAELAGATPPPNDGVSIVPTLLGRPDQKQHEFLYWEFWEGGFGQAVRMGNWKGIRTTRGKKAGDAAKMELYDIATDIGEGTNVAAKHPEMVARIEQIMKEQHTDWKPGKP